MRILLDTHTFIWFIIDDPRLSEYSARLIEDTSNDVFVSVATLWEMAIKVSLGKLHLEKTFDQLIPSQLQVNKFTILPVEINHLHQLVSLPWHHRDPFDRLMIAQSMTESLPILSRDPAFDYYGIRRLW